MPATRKVWRLPGSVTSTRAMEPSTSCIGSMASLSQVGVDGGHRYRVRARGSCPAPGAHEPVCALHVSVYSRGARHPADTRCE